jgi:hypothetical protein
VYYFHEDSEFNDPTYELEEANACCMPSQEEKPEVNLVSEQNESCCEPTNGCC